MTAARRLLTSRRARIGAAVGVLAVAVALLAGAALQGTLTYYRTPTDIATNPPAAGQQIRVGGLVVAGTVHHRGGLVRFQLTDGAHDLAVVTRAAPPSTFRAGRGAVVEGVLGGHGLFDATRVLVRHSNEYRPPAPRAAAARAGTGSP